MDDSKLSSTHHSIAEIAQLVEHIPEEDGVAGSSPALGTNKTEIKSDINLIKNQKQKLCKSHLGAVQVFCFIDIIRIYCHYKSGCKYSQYFLRSLSKKALYVAKTSTDNHKPGTINK